MLFRSDVMWRKGISNATWHDFNKFVRDYILSRRHRVSCATPGEVTTVVQRMSDVIQRAQTCYTKVAAVSIPSPAAEVKIVVPVQTVSKAVSQISEAQQSDVDKVVVCAETAVAEVEPLSGLNMQLKRVHADACKTVDKGQR